MICPNCRCEVAKNSPFCDTCGNALDGAAGATRLLDWEGYRLMMSLGASRLARSFGAYRKSDWQWCFVKIAAPELIPGIDPEWKSAPCGSTPLTAQSSPVPEVARRPLAFDWICERARGGGVRISETIFPAVESSAVVHPLGQDLLTPNEIVRRQADCCRNLSGRKGWPRHLGQGTAGREAPREWLAMEWVAGSDLRSWVACARNSGRVFAGVQGVFRRMVEILQDLERGPGWIHGDLKAAHVRIDDDEVRLLDPPLGQRPGDGIAWTCTPAYNPYRLASDAPALALMLWYALGGRLVLDGQAGVWLDLCPRVREVVRDLDGYLKLALRMAALIGGEGLPAESPQSGIARVRQSTSPEICPGPGDFMAFWDESTGLLESLWSNLKPVHGDQAWNDELS